MLLNLLKNLSFALVFPHKFFQQASHQNKFSFFFLVLFSFISGSLYITLQMSILTGHFILTNPKIDHPILLITGGGVLMLVQFLLGINAFMCCKKLNRKIIITTPSLLNMCFYLALGLWTLSLCLIYFDRIFPMINIPLGPILGGQVPFDLRFSHFFAFPWIIIALSQIFHYHMHFSRIQSIILSILLTFIGRFAIEQPNIIWKFFITPIIIKLSISPSSSHIIHYLYAHLLILVILTSSTIFLFLKSKNAPVKS